LGGTFLALTPSSELAILTGLLALTLLTLAFLTLTFLALTVGVLLLLAGLAAAALLLAGLLTGGLVQLARGVLVLVAHSGISLVERGRR
jgi:hypothetical protein